MAASAGPLSARVGTTFRTVRSIVRVVEPLWASVAVIETLVL
jgi:hypothetical protein